MNVVYALSTGAVDPTKASLPLHIAVNGSHENGDDVTIVLAGDGTEFVKSSAIENARGLGLPPMAELFAKVRHYEIPVYV